MNTGARKELAMVGGLLALALQLCGRGAAARVVGAAAGATYLWPRRDYSFRERVVVISGGSRGLGFALARHLVRQGSRVVLLARDGAELDRAKQRLDAIAPLRTAIIRCDVTRAVEVRQAIAETVGTLGKIDVWINVAGAILVGPLEATALEDLKAVLNTQVRAIWTSAELLRPVFRRAGGGKFVNISSIAEKLAVPHLGAYSTAKFALAGLSASMNADFAADSIQVTTVYPGLMRVGSAIQAVVKGDHEKELAWFALGSTTPIISVSADDAARRIMGAVARGDAELIFPALMKAATVANAVFPELTALASQVAARLLPDGTGMKGKTGADSESMLEKLPGSSVVRAALERQQRENNETRKNDPRFNLGL